MGIHDFIDTVAPEPEVLTLIGETAKRKGMNKLTMHDVDAEIAAVRRVKRNPDTA